MLLPSTWLPRWAVAGLAVVLSGAGHFIVAPGLFLLGAARTRYGVVERSTAGPAVVGLICAVIAVPLAWQQIRTGDARVFAVTGLFTAFVCVCFAPLGRMALTNYVIAAAILTAQWIVATLWLRRFAHGPLEWLWRWAGVKPRQTSPTSLASR